MGAENLMQQINGTCWQNFGDEEEADNEETISLCDLVVSSDASEYWNGGDFSNNKDDSNNNGDFFEFFSEDFPAAVAEVPNKNIVFCGKLIPFKDESVPQSLKTSKAEHENGGDGHEMMKMKMKKKKNTRSSCSFPWKTTSHYSFSKSRTFPSPDTSQSQTKKFNKSLSLPAEHHHHHQSNKKLGGDQKFDFSVKKVSILATPVKSRWYLFAFGVGRFPMDIELKDMKLRQSRKINKQAMKSTTAPEDLYSGSISPENVKGGEGRRRSSGKGLWRLLKVLGWKNKHTNGGVVQASFGCNPHV